MVWLCILIVFDDTEKLCVYLQDIFVLVRAGLITWLVTVQKVAALVFFAILYLSVSKRGSVCFLPLTLSKDHWQMCVLLHAL